MNSTPSVLIFRSELLAMSETFVLAQARALRRFSPRFAGLRRLTPSLQIPADAIVADKWLVRMYKEFGVGEKFHRDIRNAGVRLVHAHFALDGVLALPIARKLKVPLIVTLHGRDVTVPDSVWSQSRTGRRYMQRRHRMWEQAAVFICVSNFIKGAALRAGFPESKLRTHYIGVARTDFPTKPASVDPAGVLFVGRLVEKKGCDVLMRAMHTVQRQLPRAVLTVVGDGPMRSALEDLATSLGVRCTFTGAVSSAEVREFYRKTEVVCVPSRTAGNGDSEGLPMTVLEAQSMGVPIVSTCHAGIPEAVIHGQTGLLAAEGNVDALAGNLLLLLQSETLRSAYGARGRQRIAACFDLETQTRQLEDIYDEVTDNVLY